MPRLIATIAVAFLVATASTAQPLSDPPSPRPTEASQPPQPETTGDQQIATPSDNPSDAGPAISPPAQASNTAQHSNQNGDGSQDETSAGWWTWEKAVSGAIALFTLALTISTGGLWYVTYSMAKHTVAAERAYVSMSHMPPGIKFGDIEGNKKTADVTIKIENHGRPPATVAGVYYQLACGPKGGTLRRRTGPMHGHELNAFLVPKGHLEDSIQLLFEADMVQIENGTLDLWLYGYVDYRDEFGQRHRGGYARVYLPGDRGRGNNLVFGNQIGQNYDRRRKSGEGTDW